MKRTTYQVPELRDENDNIIQQGAFGKNTALANSTNDGWIDYVANDLEALYDNINGLSKQQADWNVTDSTSKAFVKNKPKNLINIGNNQKFDLVVLNKTDNAGYPVYFLMHELVQYNPNKTTLPISAVYGFNGMVFGELRVGGGGNQFLAIVKVGLGFEYNDLYSSSGHYSPVVLKDETNNKYYWAMRVNGSYQRVYMLGTFSAPPLKTAISAVDKAGTLPEGWSLVHTAKLYPFDNTLVSNASKDDQGNVIDTTYAKKSDLSSSVSTSSLTVSGETSVPTANEGNSSKAIANTAYVQGELTNYLPLSGGTLTGVVNGVTPTAGDNSTKIATTEFVNAKAGNYLPLSGGTMTGTIKVSGYLAGNTNTTSNVRIGGGTNDSNGSVLDLYGKDHSSSAGLFTISANDGTNQKYFIGKPDGTLTWDNKEVERVNTVGSGYIRYESGLQICWGKLDVADTNVTLTFPVPFTVGYATCVPNIRDTFRISAGPFTTSCTVQTSNSSTVKVQWIAVGMWK